MEPSIYKKNNKTHFQKVAKPLILSFLILFVSFPAAAIEIDELIRHIDRLWRGDTSHATMSMTVKTQRYARSMTMEAWSRGKDYSLVVIRAPIKDKGIATLKVKENIWNYRIQSKEWILLSLDY